MSFVGSLACCVGMLFVMPIHYAAVAIAYRKVFPPVETTPLSPTDGPEADYGPIQRADEQ